MTNFYELLTKYSKKLKRQNLLDCPLELSIIIDFDQKKAEDFLITLKEKINGGPNTYVMVLIFS